MLLHRQWLKGGKGLYLPASTAKRIRCSKYQHLIPSQLAKRRSNQLEIKLTKHDWIKFLLLHEALGQGL